MKRRWFCSLLMVVACAEEPAPNPFGDGTQIPSTSNPSPETPTPGPLGASDNLSLHAEFPLQIADAIFEGEFPEDLSGITVANAGDLNADGYGDFIISATSSDARQEDGGKVYLYFGSETPWFWHNNLADAPASFDGEGRSDNAGAAVVGGADFNGDGIDDLLIGAPGHGTGGIGAGRVYGLFGKAEGWYPGQRLANADFILDGLEGDEAGSLASLATGGDLNGDGYDDFVVGCATAETDGVQGGAAYVVFGSEGNWNRGESLKTRSLRIEGTTDHDKFGFSVAIHPDLDGDGFSDLVIGAPRVEVGGENSVGALYLFRGDEGFPTSGRLAAERATAVIVGSLAGEELGSGLGALGDVSGDGIPDLGVGAWGNTGDELTSSKGRFYVLSAEIPDWEVSTIFDVSARLHGDAPFDYVGRPVVPLGDVNGDNRPDVLFGSYLRDYPFQDAGNSYLYFGWDAEHARYDESLEAGNVTFIGENQGDYSGYSVAGVGDVNGDGLDDMLIGAMGFDSPVSQNIGRSYLVLGRFFYTE